MTRFAQWWRRTVRSGYAYAEIAQLHKNSKLRIYAQEVRRAIVWGGLLPLVICMGLLVHPTGRAGYLHLSASGVPNSHAQKRGILDSFDLRVISGYRQVRRAHERRAEVSIATAERPSRSLIEYNVRYDEFRPCR